MKVSLFITCQMLFFFFWVKALLVSTNSRWGSTLTSLAAQWAFLKGRQQCCTLKEAEECSWVTFLSVHASCRLMMSCYVPLSCLLSPERWNVYGGICQNTTNRAAMLDCTCAVPPCSLSCDKHWVYSTQVRKMWRYLFIFFSISFCYARTWHDSHEWVMTDVVSCFFPVIFWWSSWSDTFNANWE